MQPQPSRDGYSPGLSKATEAKPIRLWLAILVSIAAGVRLIGLGSKSFWLDESASSLLARADWHTFATALAERQANMSLYYLLLRGWICVGDSEMSLRLLSVLFGVAAIPLIYLVAAKVCGTRTARFAALLLSIHAFHIQYSQEARGYSLVVCLTLLSCYFFLRFLESDSKAALPIYILTAILMVYAHIFGALILMAQWVFGFLAGRGEKRSGHKWRLAIAAFAISLAVLPLFVCVIFVSDRSQLSWMHTGFLSNLYEFLLDLSARGGILVLILFVALLLVSLRSHLRTEARSSATSARYSFLWIWMLLPVVVVAAISMRTAILQSRYLIICLPPFLILAAHGLASLRSRAVVVLTTMALVAVLVIAVNSYDRQRLDPQRSDNWRAATSFLLSQVRPGDAILFPYSAEEIPFRDYQQRFRKTTFEPSILPTNTDLELLTKPGIWTSPELASRAAFEHQRVWIVSALQPNEHSTGVVSAIQARLKNEARTNFGFVTIYQFESSP